jgi:hypothetical protein
LNLSNPPSENGTTLYTTQQGGSHRPASPFTTKLTPIITPPHPTGYKKHKKREETISSLSLGMLNILFYSYPLKHRSVRLIKVLFKTTIQLIRPSKYSTQHKSRSLPHATTIAISLISNILYSQSFSLDENTSSTLTNSLLGLLHFASLETKGIILRSVEILKEGSGTL